MVNQIVNQISEYAYESVKSKKLNKRNTWYFCFYYRVCFFPILYKTTRKFPILGVGSCSQNAEKKPCKQEYLSTLDKQHICVNTQLKSSKKQLKWNVSVPKSNSNDRYAIRCDVIAYNLVHFLSIWALSSTGSILSNTVDSLVSHLRKTMPFG